MRGQTSDGYIARPVSPAEGEGRNGKNLQDRADTAWRKAELERITLHECRHTFASLMIAAGLNAKALSVFMVTPTSRSPSTATAT